MWNFSQSLWQDKPWLGQMMGDFFRREGVAMLAQQLL
jgi:hypothetical protein